MWWIAAVCGAAPGVSIPWPTETISPTMPECCASCAVSYTHLDVYKRQVLATLKKASAKGDTLDISNSNALDLQGLNGLSTLMGLADQCGCGGAGHKSLSGLGDLPVASPKMVVRSGRNAGMKETMTSHELENLSYQTYPCLLYTSRCV